MNEYEKQANDFLEKTNSTLKIIYVGHFSRSSDDPTDQYYCTLTNPNGTYSFEFSQSVINSKKYYLSETKTIFYCNEDNNKNYKKISVDYLQRWIKNGRFNILDGIKPSNYDVLSCLYVWEFDSFEDFCSEFGYDISLISSAKTYHAIKHQNKNLKKLYSEDEIDMLREIS